jgi:dihydroxy-acid dehydratase
MNKEKSLGEWSLPLRHALLKGVGYTNKQIEKPLIGVLNSWGEINPGAGHLDRLTKRIKAGIESGGGIPMEFALSSLCIGMAGGGRGSSYGLAYRDVVADFVEVITEANFFDGLVFTSVCDDGVPAHLMAAARINIPSIVLLGGYMPPKTQRGQARYVQEVGKAYGELKRGKISKREFQVLEDIACQGGGACPIMGTGNTMGAIAETLGMTLPGNSTVCASDPILARMAFQTGIQSVSLVKKGIKPSDILTMTSFENAIRVFLALGGSTNALIHIPAIAAELGIEIPLSLFDSLSRETPFLCNISPSGKYLMNAFDEAGGLPALLKELSPLLHKDAITVTGKPLGANIKESHVFNRDVIYPLSAPISKEGGIAILKGGLAPNGAAVKTSGLRKEDLMKRGPARVFESEDEACESLLRGKIHAGDMVILRYMGPKGGPGMRTSGARFLWLLSGLDLDSKITLISDGRFSGTNKGGAVCHVSPEAMDGGPIAVVRDGDEIKMNIRDRKLDLLVPDKEIKKRFCKWRTPPTNFKKGLLARISKTMLPPEKGGVLQRNF